MKIATLAATLFRELEAPAETLLRELEAPAETLFAQEKWNVVCRGRSLDLPQQLRRGRNLDALTAQVVFRGGQLFVEIGQIAILMSCRKGDSILYVNRVILPSCPA